MQNFSLLTSEIPDLEQFKAWKLYRLSQSELLKACKLVIAYVRRLKKIMLIFIRSIVFINQPISSKVSESCIAKVT